MTNYRKMTSLMERWNGPSFRAQRLRPDEAAPAQTARERELEARTHELERQLHGANAAYVRMQRRATVAEAALKDAGRAVPPPPPCEQCAQTSAALHHERRQTTALRFSLSVAQRHAVPFMLSGVASVQRTTAGLWKQVSVLQGELRAAERAAQQTITVLHTSNESLGRQNAVQAHKIERQAEQIQALKTRRELTPRVAGQSKASQVLAQVKAERDEAQRLLHSYRAAGTYTTQDFNRALNSEKSHLTLEYGRKKQKYEIEIRRLFKRVIAYGGTYTPVHIACDWWLAQERAAQA